MADLLPADRRTVWTPGVRTGVPGGIPTGGTIMDMATLYTMDTTGATDMSANIANAIATFGNSGNVILMPAGTLRMNSSVSKGLYQNDFVLRGAGKGVTILKSYATGSFLLGFGTGSSFNYPSTNNTVTSGLTKDSTSLTISGGGASQFITGQIIEIAFESETDSTRIASGSVPVISTWGFVKMRKQTTRIVGIPDANTLTIFPPIIHQPPAGLSATVTNSQQWSYGIGLEDFTIDHTSDNITFGIAFDDLYASWIKGVESVSASNHHLLLNHCVQCELRDITLKLRKVGGSNGSGLLLQYACNNLIIDSAFASVDPLIEANFGSSGNAIFGCFGDDFRINLNHGPHNSYNIVEFSYFPALQEDGLFGGSSENTLSGCWVSGKLLDGSQIFITSYNRYTRKATGLNNIFGNSSWPYGLQPYSFGNPNLGNSDFAGSQSMLSGDFSIDWDVAAGQPKTWTGTMTTSTVDGNGKPAGTFTLDPGQAVEYAANAAVAYANYRSISGHQFVVVASVVGDVVTFHSGSGTNPAPGDAISSRPSPGGFQEKDLDVEATYIGKGNRFLALGGINAIISGESVGADTRPTSYVYDETVPDYWTASGKPYPPFDASSATPPVMTNVPAANRYINGVDPAAPAFYLDPATQAVTEGANVTFTAAATGNPTPTYQWKKGGVDISGATSASYTITGVALGDAGSYACVAANTEGSDTSSAAVLTVNAAVATTPQPRRRSASFGFGLLLP